MSNELQKFKDITAKAAFGITNAEAMEQGLCINCKEKPTFYSAAGRAEYAISGLGEPCFDMICGEGEKTCQSG